jgi:Flp pilus assembly protein TadG
MQTVKNERGSVIVFVTLMIVLLMVMVGLGLDTGQLSYTRNMGQGAVDAAALSAASALYTGNPTEVANRAAWFNSSNNYTGSAKNTIGSANVSYVKYDFDSQIMTYDAPIATANGVRVALEGGTAMKTPVFLTPLMNLFGIATSGVQNVTVSAVSVVSAVPTLPIVVYDTQCAGPNPIKIRATDDPNETGCWTTFFDGSTSKPDVVGLMKAAGTCEGAAQGVKKGDIIHLNDGNQKPDYDAADDLFKKFTSQCWIIPVVAAPSSIAKSNNCNQWQEILDFAKICPIEVVSTKSPKYIKANVTCGQDPRTSLDSVCFTHRLVREPAKGY